MAAVRASGSLAKGRAGRGVDEKSGWSGGSGRAFCLREWLAMGRVEDWLEAAEGAGGKTG